jgi:regulator of protease activity HflC (stomatin/prohibitin superfamily)
MSDHDNTHNHDDHEHELDGVHEAEDRVDNGLPAETPGDGDSLETAAPRGPAEGAVQAAVVQSLGDTALNNALRTSFQILKLLMISMAIIYVVSGIFFATTDEVKFKMRFGRVVSGRSDELAITSKSGPQICWPWEEVVTVNTGQRQMLLSSEFWPADMIARGLGRDGRLPALDVRKDKYLLTGDRNIIHAAIELSYNVTSGESDPNAAGAFRFTLGPENALAILKRMLMTASTKLVGRMAVGNVLTPGQLSADLLLQLKRELREFEDATGTSLGIEVIQVTFPPRRLKNPMEPVCIRKSFADAQSAASNKEKRINNAREEAVRIVSAARSRAAEIISIAQKHKDRVVKMAQADRDNLVGFVALAERRAATPEARKSGVTSDVILQGMIRDLHRDELERAFLMAPGTVLLHMMPPGSKRELRLEMSKGVMRDTEGSGQ